MNVRHVRFASFSLLMLIGMVSSTTAADAAQWTLIHREFGEWRVQYDTTYDNDNYIAAKVLDILTDSSCVSAQYRDGDVMYTQATSCGAWVYHGFTDQQGNSAAYVRIRRDATGEVSEWSYITGF